MKYVLIVIVLIVAQRSTALEKPNIAVLQFSSIDPKYQRYAEVLTSNVISNVQSRRVVNVLDRGSLSTILAEAGLSAESIVKGEEGIKAGKLRGADYVISGQLVWITEFSDYMNPDRGAYINARGTVTVSWRILRVNDGSVAQQLFEVYPKKSEAKEIGRKFTEEEVLQDAIRLGIENAAKQIADKISDLFPIETHIAAVKEYDKKERYAETVYLPIGKEDGLYEDQKLNIGMRFESLKEHIINFGLLEIDKFENGLGLAEIKKGEKFVLVDSINSDEGTSPYIVRSGFSLLNRTNAVSISILPLTGNVEPAYQYALYELLSSRLFNTFRFAISDRGRISEVIRERNLQLSGIVRESELQDIGKNLGTDAILIGNIEQCDVRQAASPEKPWEPSYSASFRISARAVEVKSGQVLWAGTFDNSPGVGKFTLGLLFGSGNVGPFNYDPFELLVNESAGSFDQIINSLFEKFPLEGKVISGISDKKGEIEKVYIPFGQADGLTTDVKDIKFLIFEKEDFMGKTREIPIAKLDLSSTLDYHLSIAEIDDKVIKGDIDWKKEYFVRLVLK